VELTVEDSKVRLDKYLAAHSTESRGKVQRDIEAGLVNVNGMKVLETDFTVRQGNVVSYSPSAKEELVPINLELKILYNNHGLLIIDKPAGLSVHPGAGFKGNTLAAALLYQFSVKGGSAFSGKDIALVGEEGRPGIVHRLDKDTSGVILVARTQEMYEYLKDAFKERKIKKEYLALVAGNMEKNHDLIDIPLGKNKRDFRKYTVQGMIEPKDSLTEYWVLERFEKKGNPFPRVTLGQGSPSLSREGLGEGVIDEMTLIKVKLHTGRTHQIRVHMASVGHPLMGDTLYGGKNSKLHGLNRQFLHAKKIEVRLPDGTWIEAISDLPDDLKQVLIKLNSKIVKNI